MNSVKYNSVIVAIARFENYYIEEWINYHILIGFDHIFIYDNAEENEEGLSFIKNMYSHQVTVIEFPGRYMQGAAYQHFVDNFSAQCEWAAFLDIDEFMVLKEDIYIDKFLNKYGRLESIALNWLSFGHNGHVKRPLGFVLDQYTWRFPVCLSEVKTICRTKNLTNIHSIHNIDGKACLIDGHSLNGDSKINHSDDYLYSPSLDHTEIACINHYFTRSLEDLETKARRGSAAGTVSGRRNFEWYLSNHVPFNWQMDLVAPRLLRTVVNGRPDNGGEFYRRCGLPKRWKIPSPLDFDSKWYTSFYPDLSSDRLSSDAALDHFRSLGAHEGRKWNKMRWDGQFFNASKYYAANPDLKAAGLVVEKAEYHYMVSGQIEGRSIF